MTWAGHVTGMEKLNVKVKLFVCLTKHHAMKMYWGSGGISTHSLTSELDGGEW
jgi:hypothetical protein